MNKPVARIVQVGLENGDQAEITSGINEGDQVLVIRKRYTPQQAASNSPLVMGGPKPNNQGGGSTRREITVGAGLRACPKMKFHCGRGWNPAPTSIEKLCPLLN